MNTDLRTIKFVKLKFTSLSEVTFFPASLTRIEKKSECDSFLAGTFCSGTDAPVLVYEAFMAAAADTLFAGSGCSMPTFAHSFSCEVEDEKRAFLQDFFDMKYCFTDVLDMEKHDGRMFDVKSQNWHRVPSVDWAAAGFPCDDASSLHPNQSSTKHRLCVAQAFLGC